MVGFINVAKATALGFAVLAAAHPGHEEHFHNRAAKRSFMANSRRSLDSCAEHLEKRGTLKSAELQRRAFVEDLQKKSLAKSIRARDTDAVLNTSHHSSIQNLPFLPESTIFADNSTCILSPEGEIGPFWVTGELNRDDILEDEPGVPNYVYAQFIDINTCEPLPDIWFDIWNCNATGVYSGVQSDGNGNGDDASNLNNTALRGIQKSNEDGVAHFRTLFPGHYGGRATHVHVVAHLNATLLPNGTITGGSIPHIGQLFFDQDLITEVEATSPYNTNDVAITLNADDHVVVAETEDSNSDPLFNYIYLGDDLSDGLFSWITIGVDSTQNYNTSYAASYTTEGGVTNPEGGMADMGATLSGDEIR
ncbi:aromatic compound dioxygenase [Macroventuria anomochaeta]|uniref:Aromatic compound dioxygenase n=1 Tax=Macroventuria anomochaeta TaxID=301207 RepID=A0ACB6RK63_9PLEO|nr:aromatic compound dioxygenase [Macroventuria anomochaeta]KAF2622340.1 aromatic compound dioxygenase [Macroventuria anomochaeta]